MSYAPTHPADPLSNVVAGWWWCDLHGEVHAGELDDWTMDHRQHVHPLYVHRRHPRPPCCTYHRAGGAMMVACGSTAP